MVGRLRLLGMTYFAPVLAACATTASPPVANQSTLVASLCSVLATVADAAATNFRSIDPEHERQTGAFATTIVPPGAEHAFLPPCCASESAESGPCTWPATLTALSLDAFRARVASCPIARHLVEKPAAGAIEWRGAHVSIRMTAARGGVELTVARE